MISTVAVPGARAQWALVIVVAIFTALLIFMDYWLDCFIYSLSCAGEAVARVSSIITAGVAPVVIAISSANTATCALSLQIRNPLLLIFEAISMCPETPLPKSGQDNKCLAEAGKDFGIGVIIDAGLGGGLPGITAGLPDNVIDSVSTYIQCARGKPKEGPPTGCRTPNVALYKELEKLLGVSWIKIKDNFEESIKPKTGTGPARSTCINLEGDVYDSENGEYLGNVIDG